MQIKKVKKVVKSKKFWLISSIVYLAIAVVLIFLFGNVVSSKLDADGQLIKNIIVPKYPALNKKDYDERINLLSHLSATSTYLQDISSTTISTSTKKLIWPIKTPYPDDGALLPFNRIVAYYGNFLSTGMGVLGEYPEDQVLSMLQTEVAKWTAADPSTPVIPAIQYIAVTAQGYAGADGKYRARMPDDQIQKAIDMAAKINGIVILDVQIGQSTLEDEVPLLEKYLEMPQVHLAIDPEFAMQPGQVPGDVYVGTMDAKDINWTINYLAGLVKQYDLPPKILVIHRYREGMVTNYKEIETIPEVQVVMNMDGWGAPAGKTSIYKEYIEDEPVEFTGIKLFYKNDTTSGSTMMTTDQILKLTPEPIYIQYQ
jgi:hypothetical protein